MLGNLRNLEELYVMDVPGRHFHVTKPHAPLLQAFEKLRIAVMDFYIAPVRFILLKETDRINSYKN